MDINQICVSGRVFDMGYSPMVSSEYGVAEGKISVCTGTDKDGPMYEEFNIRAFGKKANFISALRDGTFVTITGRLREDIRVNSDNPETARTKTYINIDLLKASKQGDYND